MILFKIGPLFTPSGQKNSILRALCQQNNGDLEEIHLVFKHLLSLLVGGIEAVFTYETIKPHRNAPTEFVTDLKRAESFFQDHIEGYWIKIQEEFKAIEHECKTCFTPFMRIDLDRHIDSNSSATTIHQYFQRKYFWLHVTCVVFDADNKEYRILGAYIHRQGSNGKHAAVFYTNKLAESSR